MVPRCGFVHHPRQSLAGSYPFFGVGASEGSPCSIAHRLGDGVCGSVPHISPFDNLCVYYALRTASCSIGAHFLSGGYLVCPWGECPARPHPPLHCFHGVSIWGYCVPGGSARRAPAPHDASFTGPRRPDPDGDISAGLLSPHQARPATLHPPFLHGGRFGSPASSSPGPSSVPSFWHHHRGPSFSSSPSPRHHGGSSTPSSLSPHHHGGSSFSSSSIGIMRAKAGSSHQPPVLEGSASLAIPPSVPCEVQVASSLVATPLTNVRVLPLTVSSHPSLLGSSRDVSSGVASPPRLPLGLVLQCLLPPTRLRLRCLCQLSSLLLSVLPLFLSIDLLYPPLIPAMITSRIGI